MQAPLSARGAAGTYGAGDEEESHDTLRPGESGLPGKGGWGAPDGSMPPLP